MRQETTMTNQATPASSLRAAPTVPARGGRQLVVVGSGRLPAGCLEVAGAAVCLGIHQIDALDRLPAPAAVLVASAPHEGSPAAHVSGLRSRTCAPLVAVLDGATERDRIAVLEAGADDCVDRAIGIGELLARLAAIGRRPGLGCARVAGGVSIDVLTREVRVGGLLVDLTRREFDLLAALVSAPGRVLSHDELLREVWGATTTDGDHATVTEHVRRVRSKLRAAGGGDACIASIRGVGYRFDPSRCAAHPAATP
jgi:DNA-binding response OmpR family regulator